MFFISESGQTLSKTKAAPNTERLLLAN